MNLRTGSTKIRVRMTSQQRREQLIQVARTLFAERGVEGTSIEDIAQSAAVSKPVIYGHFGDKNGLYAVVVDRETSRLDTAIQNAIHSRNASYREIIELGAFALLDYIDQFPEGFRIISRDSISHELGETSFASILNDIASSVEDMLLPELRRRGFDVNLAGPLTQALVGLVAMAGQYWLGTRKPAKEELVRQLVNLAWNGLANLETRPQLLTAPTQDENGVRTQVSYVSTAASAENAR
ncbi:MAG: TetR/AcrR family transcriptional regulator [Propionibacteriaceae bacterium]|jgi:AcrR family transcriptional regulator|nr:TetR/AcrR family transcriptional regulator [Propionibacteriaceae bacterium]